MSKILIFGDICPEKGYRKLFDEKRAVSSHITYDMQHADLVIANLECPATYSSKSIIKTGPNIKALPKDIAYLKELGIDVLSLANNHILDYGDEGLEETLRVCRENDILTFGASATVSDAKKPLIVEVDGKKVGLIGFAEKEFNLADDATGGANHFDPYESLDEVAELKADTDYVIAFYHGGVEHYRYPSPMLRKKCRKIAEKGADLVLVQHSHCIGSMETINGCCIIYGQGNSIFAHRNDSAWDEGLLVEVNFEDGHKPNVGFRLLKATPHGIVYADEQSEHLRLSQFYEDSEHLCDEEFVKTKWVEFCKGMESLHMPSIYGRSRLFIHANRLLCNKLIDLLYSKHQKMVTMELFRCEAHREVMTTIFEEELKGYIKCPKSR